MSITLIDTNVDPFICMIFSNTHNSMSCKYGYIHSFSWFKILSKKCAFIADMKKMLDSRDFLPRKKTYFIHFPSLAG